MVAAANAWMLAFDNLSNLPAWLSDALCRLATGGGFGTRTLFTNQEEALFDAQRPVWLTGIDDVVTRGDLLDRSLLVYLPEIPDEKRRPEDEFWQAFEVVRPGILGALLDAISAGLRHLATVQVSPLPRMADFAKWVTAAAPALGWEARAFLDAHVQNRDEAHAVAVEGSAVAHAVHTLACTRSPGRARPPSSWRPSRRKPSRAAKAFRACLRMPAPSARPSAAWPPTCGRWASRSPSPVIATNCAPAGLPSGMRDRGQHGRKKIVWKLASAASVASDHA
jgi:hypothetical protein